MPEKVVLADGTEREFHTPEEVKALETKVAELEARPINPNWQEARPKVDAYNAMIPQLQAKGFKVDEKGTITFPETPPAPPTMTPEQIQEAIDKGTDRKLFDVHMNSKIASLTTEQQAAVKATYAKLIAGEVIASTADVDKFVGKAIRIEVPQPQIPPADPRYSRATGLPPLPHTPTTPAGAPQGYESNGFADTDAGKAMANGLFGKESFAAVPTPPTPPAPPAPPKSA